MHNTCDIFPFKNHAIKKSIVLITAQFTHANDCVLFVPFKLVFAALPSGKVWVDVAGPSVVSGVANYSRYIIFKYLLLFRVFTENLIF